MNNYKSLIIIVLLFTIGVLECVGQKKFSPEWNVGAGFGSTMSSASFSPKLPTKTYYQYQGGVAIRYMSEKNLGLIGELNYSQNGWIEEFKEQPQNAYSRQLNYLEMPFLTHIYFGNKFRFIINLGPKIGFLLSEKEEINQDLIDHLASGDVDGFAATYQYFHKTHNKIDYGIIGGAGFEFRSGVGNFALEGRYYMGLGDFYRNSKADYFGQSGNRVISVKLTYYTKVF